MIAHPIESEYLFQYYFIVDLSSNRQTVKARYPEDASTSDEILDKILHLAQAIHPFDLPDEVNNRKNLAYVDLIDLPSENEDKTITYFVYVFNSSSKAPLKILLSQYYHPNLLSGILENDICNNDSSLFHKLSKISFVEKNTDILINLSDNDIPEKYSHFLKTDLSQISEISLLRRIFLSQFPPYYMYQLIYYLFRSFKIIICSSSIEQISKTVFAINSFLYPLQKDTFLIKTIPLLNRKDKDLIKIDGPCIIGVHSSIINEVLPILPPESKYTLFNTDIPYIISQPKNFIGELELECHSSDQKQIKQDALQKERSITSLFHNAHRDTITYVYQFEHVFPAFHIQSRISEFIIGMIKVFFNIGPKKDLLKDIVQEIDNAKNDPRFQNLLKKGSLCEALLNQLHDPSEFKETFKLYFPKESKTPVITVPQLRTDFIELYNSRPSSPTLRVPPSPSQRTQTIKK